MTAQAQIPEAPTPAVVVFGRDEAGKPHASSFAESEVDLATKAATLMGMRLLTVETDAERALAIKVPKGKVFASGRAFTPFVKATLFEELEKACPAGLGEGPPKPIKTSTGKNGSHAPTSSKTSQEADPSPAAVRQPSNWAEIPVGSIVLATSSSEHAEWYECIVTAVKADRITLQFCDFPERKPVHRRRMEVGLMHPLHQPAPPLEAEPSSPVA